MFEMGGAGFEPFEPLQSFIVHARNGSQIFLIRQTTSTVASLCLAQNAAGKAEAGSAIETGSSVIASS
jgi:hypothetical protein